MDNPMRTHSAASLNASHVGADVRVAGWVHSRRDHGGLFFFDLRDRSGLVQVVFSSKDVELHLLASQLRAEYVVAIEGKVVKRSPETVNKELPTGEIEIAAHALAGMAASYGLAAMDRRLRRIMDAAHGGDKTLRRSG